MCAKDIPSLVSIDTLDWHLDQHLINILIDTQSTFIQHLICSRSIVSGVSTNSYALIGNLWIVNQDFDGLSIDSQLSFGRSVNQVSIEC